jgi:hypothetical protein
MQLTPRNHQSSATMKELRALNARFIHNFVTNDVPSHDAILHPGFINIWPTGQRWDRATYLTVSIGQLPSTPRSSFTGMSATSSLPSSATLRLCAPRTSTRAAAMEKK